VWWIEDLISTGKSSLQAVHALRDAGYTVAGLAAIFSYGLILPKKTLKRLNARSLPYLITRPFKIC
jgi:orotate phosphoribosyltransferase